MLSQHLVIGLIALLLPLQLHATHNRMLLIIDGLNRDTLYALMNKKQLPALSAIAKQGGVRNMDIDALPHRYENALSEILTGQSLAKTNHSLPLNKTLMHRLKTQHPDMAVNLVFSTPRKPQPVALETLFDALPDAYFSAPIIERTSQQTLDAITASLAETGSPFLLVANFTSVAYLGHKYREGAERYSLALMKVDRMIGQLLRFLEANNLRKNTQIWISTTMPLDKNQPTQLSTLESFVISTEKLPTKESRPWLYSRLLQEDARH